MLRTFVHTAVLWVDGTAVPLDESRAVVKVLPTLKLVGQV